MAMLKLKQQIEGQLQEIVFFFSLLIAFTFFLSGILYLTLSADSLTYVLGQFGALVDYGLFAFLGYGYFYLTVMTLHMGYVTNFHVFNFSDFKKQSSVLLYSFLAHSIVLVLFSNMLSVIQISLELTSSAQMANGAGGLVGHLLSPTLYANIGIYGSLLFLIALMSVTALLGGFFEIPDVVVAFKSASRTTKKATMFSLKSVNHSLVQSFHFLAKGNDMNEAMLSASSRNWISNSWNKANNLMTDHFHIYKSEKPTIKIVEKKEEKAEKKVSKNETQKNADKKLVDKKLADKKASLKKEETITLVKNPLKAPQKMTLNQVAAKIATEKYIAKTISNAKAVATAKNAMADKTMLSKKAAATATLTKLTIAKANASKTEASKTKAKKK